MWGQILYQYTVEDKKPIMLNKHCVFSQHAFLGNKVSCPRIPRPSLCPCSLHPPPHIQPHLSPCNLDLDPLKARGKTNPSCKLLARAVAFFFPNVGVVTNTHVFPVWEQQLAHVHASMLPREHHPSLPLSLWLCCSLIDQDFLLWYNAYPSGQKRVTEELGGGN